MSATETTALSGSVQDRESKRVLALLRQLGPEACRRLGQLMIVHADAEEGRETEDAKVAEIVGERTALLSVEEAATMIGDAFRENASVDDLLRLGGRMLRLSAEKVQNDDRTPLLNGCLLGHVLTGVLLETLGHPAFAHEGEA